MPSNIPHSDSAGRDPRAGRVGSGEGRHAVLVWDLPLRVFHWLLAVLVAAAYFTWRFNWMAWHAWCGQAVLALVLFRLVWGVVGSDTARFSRFLAAPSAAIRHLARVFRREPDTQCGHNPAGGWMVLLLLLLLLGQSVSGVIVNNDVANDGPLTAWMPASVANLLTDMHGYLWDALLAAIVLHLLAIGLYAALKGQNLVLPMVTGVKSLPASQPQPRIAGIAAAFLVFCLSVGAAALIAGLA